MGIAVVLAILLTRAGYLPAIPQYLADQLTAGPWAGIPERRFTGIEIRFPNETLERDKSSAAMNELLEDLATSRSKAASLGSYTAVLEMQEERNGRLTDPKIVDIKFRRNPFSVYLHWRSNSQVSWSPSTQADTASGPSIASMICTTVMAAAGPFSV